VTSKTATLVTSAALFAEPNTAKSALTNSEHHHQLLKGVGALENEIAQDRRTVSPPIRAGPAVSKPPVAYSIPEAARAASIGITKLRNEIRAGRLTCRKLGKRSIITANDLEKWAAALPDIRDVAPNAAAAALKDFRKSA
jgi:hypothetical protein